MSLPAKKERYHTPAEYLALEDAAEYRSEYYLDENRKWASTEYRREDNVLKFSSVDFQITLRELYERVEFK